MKKLLIIVCCLIVLIGIIYLILTLTGPKKKDYVHLTEPRIITKDDVRSLVVTFDGDANKVLKGAFGKLFKKYFSLKGVPKGSKQPAPMARYENFDNNLELVQEEIYDMPWKGFVSIPVPEDLKIEEEDGVQVKNVDYGLVAELVHFGPYEEETENINKLKNFIENEGYKIKGLHEEEYIKGPGLFYVPPKNYITIIRYQIEKE